MEGDSAAPESARPPAKAEKILFKLVPVSWQLYCFSKGVKVTQERYNIIRVNRPFVAGPLIKQRCKKFTHLLL